MCISKHKWVCITLLLFVVFCFGFLLTEYKYAYAEYEVERIWGENRYETAVQISDSGWSTSEKVVIATGQNYPDALAGVPLAYHMDAPILLTQTNALPSSTKEELQNLKASKAYLLGGAVAISENVENTLKNEGLEVKRIGGENRYETAGLIAEEMAPSISDTAVIAYGNDFKDALIASPYAAVEGHPILLSGTDSVSEHTMNALETLDLNNTVVVGGPDKISDHVVNDLPLGERVHSDPAWDHYSNAVAAASYFEPASNKIYFATGEDFADAIAGGVLAAKENSGIMLVDDTVPIEVNDYLINKNISTVPFLGGPAAVSDKVKQELTGTEEPEDKTELSTADIYEKVRPSVVSIKAYNQNGHKMGAGSGFIVESDGKIVTNYHVIEGSDNAKVYLTDGSSYEVTYLLNYDKEKDIAYLKIDADGLPVVDIGDFDEIRTGDKAVAIGDPLGYEGTVSEGVISTKNREIDGNYYVQTTAPVSPGNSGGPLLNAKAEVIGIITWTRLDGQNLNFAIPIDEAKPYFNENLNIPFSELVEETATEPEIIEATAPYYFIDAPLTFGLGEYVYRDAIYNNSVYDVLEIEVDESSYLNIWLYTNTGYYLDYLYFNVYDSKENAQEEKDALAYCMRLDENYIGASPKVSPGTYYIVIFSDPNYYYPTDGQYLLTAELYN